MAKVLRSELCSSSENIERFEREIRALRSVHHANVVAIHGEGRVDGRPYVVMERAPGKCLRELLGRGPLDVETAGRLAEAIAEGLAAAHDVGIVHRDLKPENIYVDRDAQSGNLRRVKILDFGMARIEKEAPITSPGFASGSSEYMSPEQVTGAPLGPASDLYALGVLLYEMLVGTPPFEGRTAPAILAQHLYRKPKAPRRAAPQRDFRGLDRVALKCLAKEPDRRFVDAREVARAIDDLLGRRRRRSSRRGSADVPMGQNAMGSAPGAVRRWYRSARRWLGRRGE